MDKEWNVSSKPNHFHPRFTKNGFNSPMTGDFSIDIPLLIEMIKNHKLLDERLRF